MPKFRKKAVVIEAVQVDEALRFSSTAGFGLPIWLAEAQAKGAVVFEDDGISIKTLEGTMRGDRGDWIICGVKGELYPCKGDIFAATYDAVEGEGINEDEEDDSDEDDFDDEDDLDEDDEDLDDTEESP